MGCTILATPGHVLYLDGGTPEHVIFTLYLVGPFFTACLGRDTREQGNEVNHFAYPGKAITSADRVRVHGCRRWIDDTSQNAGQRVKKRFRACEYLGKCFEPCLLACDESKHLNGTLSSSHFQRLGECSEITQDVARGPPCSRERSAWCLALVGRLSFKVWTHWHDRMTIITGLQN